VNTRQLADLNFKDSWSKDPAHQAFLMNDARKQYTFFDKSLRGDGGFDVLDINGTALPRAGQELHTTTRLIHSYSLGVATGHPNSARMVDAGMKYLWNMHRDKQHGGFFWSVDATNILDDLKLAYGHVFVLLAASSAKLAGHPDADRILADVADILDRYYWDDQVGLYRDEFARDWQPFSTYRGMNSNMHAVEAMLVAFEATGETFWLDRTARILDFFTNQIAPKHDWRLPEHFHQDWRVNPDFFGNPIFRPAGCTPGHSFELSRLLLQYWDLSGRTDPTAFTRASHLVMQAFNDAWLPDGGLAYTTRLDGSIDIASRFWWPVTEAIGVFSALQKLDKAQDFESLYRRTWTFANSQLIDHENGGWFPELDISGQPVSQQFLGKPDLYHSLQAVLFPLVPSLSRHYQALKNLVI
tara:strand:+ start:376 stop:1614 length:1239 start_codon:yes stop_codon:yes gene_type:complete